MLNNYLGRRSKLARAGVCLLCVCYICAAECTRTFTEEFSIIKNINYSNSIIDKMDNNNKVTYFCIGILSITTKANYCNK